MSERKIRRDVDDKDHSPLSTYIIDTRKTISLNIDTGFVYDKISSMEKRFNEDLKQLGRANDRFERDSVYFRQFLSNEFRCMRETLNRLIAYRQRIADKTRERANLLTLTDAKRSLVEQLTKQYNVHRMCFLFVVHVLPTLRLINIDTNIANDIDSLIEITEISAVIEQTEDDCRSINKETAVIITIPTGGGVVNDELMNDSIVEDLSGRIELMKPMVRSSSSLSNDIDFIIDDVDDAIITEVKIKEEEEEECIAKAFAVVDNETKDIVIEQHRKTIIVLPSEYILKMLLKIRERNLAVLKQIIDFENIENSLRSKYCSHRLTNTLSRSFGKSTVDDAMANRLFADNNELLITEDEQQHGKRTSLDASLKRLCRSDVVDLKRSISQLYEVCCFGNDTKIDTSNLIASTVRMLKEIEIFCERLMNRLDRHRPDFIKTAKIAIKRNKF